MTTTAQPPDGSASSIPPIDQARALFNILDDYGAEKDKLARTQTALLNILEDATAREKELREAHTASLNILEDAANDRRAAEDAFSASLNIMSDLEAARVHLAKQAEELSRTNAALMASNADLETFAYVASHDLSEPLRAISMPITILANKYKGQLDEEADEWITFAVEGCERMQALINDLLTYSRVGRIEGEVRPVNVGDVLPKVLDGLKAVIEEKSAEVTVGPMPTVRAEATQLGQVLQNLLSNALKFVDPQVPPRVEITATRQGGQWLISVTDNGIGIKPAYRENIFGMFKRLHGRGQYPGTGIGLALAKKIIERHGGTIGVTDGPDGGSRFWFTLDAVDEAAGAG